jgi:hypothetical protein
MGYVLSKIQSLVSWLLLPFIGQAALTFTTSENQENAVPNADAGVDLLALNPPISVFATSSSSFKEKSIRDLNKESASFVWFQLLIEALTRMPLSNQAKNELLTECRQQYQDNPGELEKILEFDRDCSLVNCIHWYTRDCFLYRLLNQAFRTENIDEILKFRFFIRQLNEQLSVLHKDYVDILRSIDFDSITVYRGQTMAADELQKLRVRIQQKEKAKYFLLFSRTILVV